MLLASHISLFLFFFGPESQSDAEGGATVLGPPSDKEEDGWLEMQRQSGSWRGWSALPRLFVVSP